MECQDECSLSENHFKTDTIVLEIRDFVNKSIEGDYGHGLTHVTKVSLDAGAILVRESRLNNKSEKYINRKLTIIQTAGMLHDYMRKMDNHARAGADFARDLLKNINWFTYEEIDEVWMAILSHEAFCKKPVSISFDQELISGALYDADKFRWGPDNFRKTVWDMVKYSNISIKDFLNRYPTGIKSIRKIKDTFRTETGKHFGPQFINTGLKIGKTLHEQISREFPEYF